GSPRYHVMRSQAIAPISPANTTPSVNTSGLTTFFAMVEATLAVIWAAFFNFVAFLVFGTKVASTIAKDVVKPEVFTLGVVFAGLMGAIAWDLITWYLGLPTSSSHALVGGMAGAAVARSGWSSLITTGFRKIAVFIVLSPIIGLLLGFT